MMIYKYRCTACGLVRFTNQVTFNKTSCYGNEGCGSVAFGLIKYKSFFFGLHSGLSGLPGNE